MVWMFRLCDCRYFMYEMYWFIYEDFSCVCVWTWCFYKWWVVDLCVIVIIGTINTCIKRNVLEWEFLKCRIILHLIPRSMSECFEWIWCIRVRCKHHTLHHYIPIPVYLVIYLVKYRVWTVLMTLQKLMIVFTFSTVCEIKDFCIVRHYKILKLEKDGAEILSLVTLNYCWWNIFKIYLKMEEFCCVYFIKAQNFKTKLFAFPWVIEIQFFLITVLFWLYPKFCTIWVSFLVYKKLQQS